MIAAAHGDLDDSFACLSENAMQAFLGFVRALEGAEAIGLLRAGDPLLIVNAFWSAQSVHAILETGLPAILRHFSPPSRP